MPVNHAATVVAWPSCGMQRFDTTLTESRNGSSGFRIGENPKSAPTVSGVQ